MPIAPPSLSLLDLGWDEGWAEALAAAQALTPNTTVSPGRVSRVDRGISTVLTAAGEGRIAAVAGLDLAVGDWVTLAAGAAESGQWALAGILPRRCAFRRVADAPAAREQVVVANIDTVFLVDALDGRLSVHHLERYVALALQSGAVPAIVVTKADLASPEQLGHHLADVAEAAPGVAAHVVSVVTGQGLDALDRYLAPGRTVALLGLSGAGKSTLVNRLAGQEVLATTAVRSDGKGRHTTTYRELVALPGGGLIIDTPGMRALSVASATEGVALAFAEIEALATGCGFPDCSHVNEPGCAVLAAVASGQLSVDRLESWRRLKNETPAEDPEAARRRIVERNRRKALAKATRSRLRASQRKR